MSDESGTPIDRERLQEKVLEYVEDHEATSFVELERLLDGDIQIEGEQHWVSPEDENIIIWPNISEQFASLIQELMADGQLYMHPCQKIVYLADGKGVDLEVVKRPPVDGYSSQRWLPVVFSTLPWEEYNE